MGDFPSTWKLMPLSDCMATIIDYRGKTPRKTSAGIPLIIAKIVKDGRIEAPEEFIDPAEYEKWMRRGLPERGDVLVTTEAPLGEVAQLRDAKVALAQRLIALRGKPGLLDNTFLKFLMQSTFVQEQLEARSSGTTVLGIKQSELRHVSLIIPEFIEQQAIACILSSLDAKIELNRRTNKTLEAMAQAIFQSWFVDFDPVRAKIPGTLGSSLAELAEHREERENVEGKRRYLEGKLRRLRFLFLDEEDMNEGEYRRRKADLQAQLDALRTPETPEIEQAAETLESLGQEWAHAPMKYKHDMLRCIFEAIFVDVEAQRLVCVKPYPPFVPLFRMDGLEGKEDGCFYPAEEEA